MKTRPSSLDPFFSFLWWRSKKRYINQFSSWILEGFKILQSRMRYKTADNRPVNKNSHEESRSAPLVFYFNFFFFLIACLYIVFAERTLPTVSFHAIFCMSLFKVWTRPFVLITLWWRLSCHHPYTVPVNTTTQVTLIEQIKPWRAWTCVKSALTQVRCFILCSSFLVNLCALLLLQYSLTQVTCTVNIYLTLRFI